MSGTTLLSLRNLSVWYTVNHPVLSGFSLDLGTNEVVGLIGLNGAVLAAAALLPLGLLKEPSGAVCARLKVDGKVVCEITSGTYRWQVGEDYLEFCFEDGRALVLASSCPDQTCVQSGEVYGAGRAILCLPNRAAVELAGPDAADAVV